ncbi:MAG: M24 family metallopeptidase [Actinomycetia bacterium]|nr:M24 family metallopeptidase [Actinomycetes bacterium]
MGERAALPPGAAGGRRLSAGDVLLIDAAVTSGCYWADVTRCATVWPPSDEVTAAWDAVMAAHAAGVAAAGPGATASDVDRAAREEIVERGLGEAFIHRTGRGLGLEVHEAPYLSSTSGEVLQPGMVVTIEPGVYLRGRFGLRLEDGVLVTESGGEILTEAIPSGLRAL